MSLVSSVSRCAVLGLVVATACLDDARVPSEQAVRTPGLSALTVSSAALATGAAAGAGACAGRHGAVGVAGQRARDGERRQQSGRDATRR